MNEKIFSVYEFNSIIDNLLVNSFPQISVEGEVSKITIQQTSGHWYFTIKDEKASLDCVLFKFNAMNQTFIPRIGDKVVAVGTPNLYPNSGRFQLKCSRVKQAGMGSLLEIIEQNKRKWMNTYFTRPKREIPRFVKTIAVVTSPTGAVLHDIIRARNKRDKRVNIKVIPAVMQGETCAESVSAAIILANELQDKGILNADVLIVARGGGSFEDLYPFNDEKIVKAMAESKLICISAIGHDPDNPLCDYAADKRAATPTQAAEFACTSVEEFSLYVQNLKNNLNSFIYRRIENAYQKNDYDLKELINLLDRKYRDALNFISVSKDNLPRLVINLFEEKKRLSVSQRSILEAYSPYGILERGYNIAKDEKGRVIKSSSQLKKGTKFKLQLQDGSIDAVSEG